MYHAAAAGSNVTFSWTAGTMTSGATTFIHRLSTKALQAGTLVGVAPSCAWTDSFTTTSTIPPRRLTSPDSPISATAR